jgi:hypothetical protein
VWNDWKCANAKAWYAVETLNNPGCIEAGNLNIPAIRDLAKYCGSTWRDNYLEDSSSDFAAALLLTVGLLII